MMEDKLTEKQKNKPIEEWTVTDFLAAGINVTPNTATSRVTNTSTGTPGLKDTRLMIVRDPKRAWKFAK